MVHSHITIGVMRGFIGNISRPDFSRFEDRDQTPVFLDADGTPVFEVWFWHADLRLWFVMSHAPDAQMQVHGVVYFNPGELPDQLYRRVRDLESQAGVPVNHGAGLPVGHPLRLA